MKKSRGVLKKVFTLNPGPFCTVGWESNHERLASLPGLSHGCCCATCVLSGISLNFQTKACFPEVPLYIVRTKVCFAATKEFLTVMKYIKESPSGCKEKFFVWGFELSRLPGKVVNTSRQLAHCLLTYICTWLWYTVT